MYNAAQAVLAIPTEILFPHAEKFHRKNFQLFQQKRLAHSFPAYASMKITFFKDFKEFAIRGNIIDLSVGIIVGASFNKIVDVIVNGVILPPIGLVTGGLNFKDKKIVLKEAVLDNAGKIIRPENAVKYGELIETTIIFIITAFAVFLLIRAINAMRREHHEKNTKEAQKALPPQEKLLTEIRDILKTQKT
jgi:large conductance mechanosensitive channel